MEKETYSEDYDSYLSGLSEGPLSGTPQQKRFEELRDKLHERDTELAGLRSQLEHQASLAESYENNLKSTEEELKLFKKQAEEYKNQLKLAEEKNDEMQQVVDYYKMSTPSLPPSCAPGGMYGLESLPQGQTGSESEELESLRVTHQITKEELAEIKATHETTVEELEGLKVTYQSAEKELASLKVALQSYERDLANSKIELQSCERDLESTREELERERERRSRNRDSGQGQRMNKVDALTRNKLEKSLRECAELKEKVKDCERVSR